MKVQQDRGIWFAREFADVWYVVTPKGESDGWILKSAVGYFDEETGALDCTAMFLNGLGLIIVWSVFAAFQYYHYESPVSPLFLSVIFILWLPHCYAWFKARWLLVPRLKRMGYSVEFAGAVWRKIMPGVAGSRRKGEAG